LAVYRCPVIEALMVTDPTRVEVIVAVPAPFGPTVTVDGAIWICPDPPGAPQDAESLTRAPASGVPEILAATCRDTLWTPSATTEPLLTWRDRLAAAVAEAGDATTRHVKTVVVMASISGKNSLCSLETSVTVPPGAT